ncbi:MAG: hypothetical protein KTR26_10555 [Flammeovirgaceae bacterium]|nr:hypothetical protein [Flammeovirgaceae bacterium]
MDKFEDNGKQLSEFGNYRIIACPQCQKPIDFYAAKIICDHCGYLKEIPESESIFSVFPISNPIRNYLSINCCGKELWAENLEHLTFIEEFVKADLRIRTPNINQSLASRLPQWIKSKKNRTEVLKCIHKLWEKLKNDNYQKRFRESKEDK